VIFAAQLHTIRKCKLGGLLESAERSFLPQTKGPLGPAVSSLLFETDFVL